MKRCQAKIKGGDQCRNNAIPGTNFCYLKSHGAGHINLGKRALNFLLNKWLTFLFSLILLVLAVTPIVKNYYKSKLHSSAGILNTEGEATEKKIAIGGISIILKTSNNVVIRDSGEPVLSIQIKKNKLYVSTIIRDDKGNLIAEIHENEWKLNANNLFDKNYTDNAHEVRNSSGNIVLQVVNFGEVIHFAGLFHTKKGLVVSFVPLKDMTAVIEISQSEKDLVHHIDPIFKYPSDLHFGSCPAIKDLEKIIRTGHSTFYFSGPLDIGEKSKGQGIIRLL